MFKCFLEYLFAYFCMFCFNNLQRGFTCTFIYHYIIISLINCKESNNFWNTFICFVSSDNHLYRFCFIFVLLNICVQHIVANIKEKLLIRSELLVFIFKSIYMYDIFHIISFIIRFHNVKSLSRHVSLRRIVFVSLYNCQYYQLFLHCL